MKVIIGILLIIVGICLFAGAILEARNSAILETVFCLFLGPLIAYGGYKTITG
jgi:hypothetical protein